MGIDNLAVCSGGAVVENPRVLKPALGCLRRLGKAIARSRNIHDRTVPSNRRERLYARLRRMHVRIVNVRNELHHKATTAIAKSAGRVVIQDLNVGGPSAHGSTSPIASRVSTCRSSPSTDYLVTTEN